MKTTAQRLVLLSLAALFTVPAVRAQAGGPDAPDSPPPGQRERPRPPKKDRLRSAAPADNYTLAQATSDNAQLHTIAFNGLAF